MKGRKKKALSFYSNYLNKLAFKLINFYQNYFLIIFIGLNLNKKIKIKLKK